MKSIITAFAFLAIMAACSSNNYYPEPIPESDGGVKEVDASTPPVPQADSSTTPPVVIDASMPICNPENDSMFCSRLQKECGGLTQLDNCKALRIAECGDCNTGSTCNSGSCKVIPPNCVAESNTAFCSRNGYGCGTRSASDNCGNNRTVSSCGSLRCLGNYSSIPISGGVPNEIAGYRKPMHIEGWIKPQAGYSQSEYYNNIFNLGYSFGISVHDGMAYLNVRGTKYGGVSVLEGVDNYWTFLFAGYENGSYYFGKIVNDVAIRQTFVIPDPYPYYPWLELQAGSSAYIANGFIGQINQFRVWSVARTNEDIIPTHHNCLANQNGLIRQWCMREGVGTTITDSVTLLPSILDGVAWSEGTCK